MKSTFVSLAVIVLHTLLNAQTKLNWSESFVSDTHLNQITVAMDSLGNTWSMMTPEGGIDFVELKYRVEASSHPKNVVVRVNSRGKTDRVISIEDKLGGSGIGAIACNAKNEVWIVSPYSGADPEVKSIQHALKVKGDTIPGGLLLSAVTPAGQIRFAVELPIRYSNESFFLTFDRSGNAHLLTSRADRKYGPEESGSHTEHPYYTLQHTILNERGEIKESREYAMGEMRGTNCRYSKIHFTPQGDYYITTRMTASVLENGKLIIKDTNPPPRNEYDKWEDHAVLMHFNNNGKFDWHRLFFGTGNQLISAITSDSNNVYLAVSFNYECASNATNQIAYEDREMDIVEGMERVCMDHTGKTKWIDRISGRRYYSAGLHCWGIETDRKGRLIYFCAFRDTLSIRGHERNFVLDWITYSNDQSFTMISDTSGKILDVRRDLYSTKGRGIVLSSSSKDNTFTCGGMYFSQFVGTEYDSVQGAWTKGEMRTDLHVEMEGSRGGNFRQAKYSGGVFAYSFDLPPLIPVEESPEEPLYVNQPAPEELQALSEDSDQHPIEEPAPEESIIEETKPAVSIQESIVMELFPNPTRSGLTIQLSQLAGPSELYMHDAAGTLILSKAFFAIDPEITFNYNAGEWNAGRYLVTCYSGGQKVTKVLVVTG